MLATFDWIVIGVYFAFVAGIVVWITRRDSDIHNTSSGYFLGGRNAGWFVIGTSLFASNIGSEHLVGLAGTGAQSGLAVGQFEVLASLILIILGWVFVPFYIRSGVSTMPEFLERRFSSQARWYLAFISIFAYVITKISVTIMAGGIVFQALGIDFWTGALVVVIGTGIYTTVGGLRAVLYTDLLQAFVLIGGAITVTLVGLSELGGWNAMTAQAGDGFLDMWKTSEHPDFPWTGILFGAPILGVWYWCTDQFIVQRVLAAKNIQEARRGTIFGGYLKLLPLFIFVLPGVIAYCLHHQEKISLLQDGQYAPDTALPVMITTLLPVGLKGLVVAGLLAALMSSLSSVFNSCSTLITLDVYKKLRPDAPEKRLVRVGQMATGALVIFGLAWIPLMKLISSQLFVYLQKVQAYISPPIAAVFLLGVLWKRLNASGAHAALGAGFVLGVGRLVAEMNLSNIAPDSFLYDFATINFLHFAAALFVVCSSLLILISLVTDPPPDEKVADLTLQTANVAPSKDDKSWRSRRLDMGLTLVLAALVGLVWIAFS